MVERQKIGNGSEHEVFASRHHNNWVLKRPSPITLAMLRLTGFGISKLRKEYEEARSEALKTPGIRVPQTRIFDTKKIFGLNRFGYIIAQRRIEQDGVMVNPVEVLRNQGNPLFAKIYEATRKADAGNFICNQGLVYFVDPFHAHNRLVERFFGLTFPQIIRAKAFIYRGVGLR